MSPPVIKPSNFSLQLAMYMEAAAIGTVPVGLENGRVIFENSGSDVADLQNIIVTDPKADDIEIVPIVEAGSARGPKSIYTRFMEEVAFVQGVADANLKRGKGKGNFRRDAEVSEEWAQKFFSLPEEQMGTMDAALAFLESAFLYTRFHQFDDLRKAKELFTNAAICFAKMKRYTTAAIAYELGEEMLRSFDEQTPTRNILHHMAAKAWLASLDEYREPDSERMRIFRALVHNSFVLTKGTRKELFRSLAEMDFRDESLYEYYSNNVRLAYVMSNDVDITGFEWRAVKEVLESALSVWGTLEESGFDIAESLTGLSLAAEAFSQGGTQFVM